MINPKLMMFRCFLGYIETFNTKWQYFLFLVLNRIRKKILFHDFVEKYF